MRRISFLFLMLFCLACSRTLELDSATSSSGIESSLSSDGSLQLVVPSEGGTTTINVASSSSWTAQFINQNAKLWCHLSSNEGKKGTSLSVKVEANVSNDERVASFSIVSGELKRHVTITQKQKDAILLSTNTVVVSSDKETIDISVRHNIDYSVEVSTDCQEWITLLTTRSLTDDHVQFLVSENSGERQRVGTILFKSSLGTETVRVYQDGFVPTMLISQSSYTLGYEEQTFSVEVKSNVEYDVELAGGADWIHYTETRAVSTNTVLFIVDKNVGLTDREGTIVFSNKANGITETVRITQLWDDQGYIEVEKQALIALYKSTNGDNWKPWFNSNWCFDEPLDRWGGVTLDEAGHVKEVVLSSCNLSGHLPPEVGDLIFLENFNIYYNHVGGEIPSEFGNCKRLKALNLRHNDFIGHLPASIGDLQEMQYWDFTENSLSGPIPESIKRHPLFKEMWADLLVYNNITYSYNDFPVPSFDVVDLDGNRLVSEEVYAKKKYTVLIQVLDICISIFESYLPQLKELYEKHNSEVEFILYSIEPVDAIKERYNLPWRCFQYKKDSNHIGGRDAYPKTEKGMGYPYWGCIIATVIKEGKEISFVNLTKQSFGQLFDYFNKEFYGIESGVYHSTDFSRDGEVVSLQQATEGNGINIVLLGDGFSDREIKDGVYDHVMNKAYESFFEVEPYRSYKHLFNVNYVEAVSMDEGVSKGNETTFGSIITADNGIDINMQGCQKYVTKVVPWDEMEQTLVIMIVKADMHTTLGMCHMLYPDTAHDYGDGFSVACCTWNKNEDSDFRVVVHHEACGHGFAKLGDEYWYDGRGQIPESQKVGILSQVPNGWWKNIDFTNDPSQVKWSKFLNLDAYRMENLGCYEGGFIYEFGVWRPSYYSIMRYNTGGFNAPSREAIWYRIHKLAFGDNWQYSFEDFLDYDRINIPVAPSNSTIARQAPVEYHSHPPVIIKNLQGR